MRILIIEDEINLADAISIRLKKEKFIVDICNDGEEGLDCALTNNYDLIILDVMLPKVNGFMILENIRKEKVTSKVIILTAKHLLEDKLKGLNSGANDYLTKPFHIDELVARINVLLRNDDTTLSASKKIEYEDLILDINTSSIICKVTGESINIVGKEFFLLEYFMKNPNQVISKEQIYCKIWGIDSQAESNNLEAYLSFVRKKLKIIGSKVNIKSLRNMGYKLEVENE